MANQYFNKIIVGGEVKIDLTPDTVEADKLLSAVTAHDKSGAPIVGTCTYDADTSDATAAASELLLNKTAYVNGVKITGAMPNNGAVAKDISAKDEVYTVPQGYHDGSGKVKISAAEQAKLVAENIREGVTILGVEGTMSGSEDMRPQAKVVTPTFEQREVLPDTEENYNCLSSVTVNAISVTETDNAAGGKTLTVG